MCMVFRKPSADTSDQITDEHFKSGPQIVKQLQGARLEVKLYQPDSKDEVYCLIGAKESRLQEEAERTQYELPLDIDTCYAHAEKKKLSLVKLINDSPNVTKESVFGNLYAPYEVNHGNLFMKNTDSDAGRKSIFRTADRVKLIISIVEANDGAGLSMEKLLHAKGAHLVAFFALHEASHKENLQRQWRSWRCLFSQPLEDIRNYFGEEIGLYFSFLRKILLSHNICSMHFMILLEYYNQSLFVIAAIGLFFFIAAM